MENDSLTRYFSASMGKAERLITWVVAFGVGMGLPLLLGIIFAITLSQPLLFLFPLPFLIAFSIPFLIRPRGYSVSPDRITVLRTILPRVIPLQGLSRITIPAETPPGFSLGLARVEGVFSTSGTYWNKSWGRFYLYLTNRLNSLELRLLDDTRILLSPDDPRGFVDAVEAAARKIGREIDILTNQ
jgi:hypothetical protein